MGVGQIYVGKVGRGIVIMLGGFALIAASYIVIFSYLLSDLWYDGYYPYDNSDFVSIMAFALVIGIIHLVYFLWQAYDGYKLAKEYNQKLCDTGQPPW
ncbi:MAG: hypothetical protein LBU30_05825 [Candidatus Methanoplasma sp.]|jgi:hypothetical protein|nr:hypothetical protein [Candidatus Methanoplasma sp.]